MPGNSGQTTVPTPGTAVPLGTTVINAAFMVKALETNTGIVAIGNDGQGDVSLTSGMRLQAGESAVFDYCSTLGALFLDAEVSGEGVCWLALFA